MSAMKDTCAVEYRPIEGFPNYRVGDDGSVWSQRKQIRGRSVITDEWTRLKPTCASHGYPTINLSKDKKPHGFLVHRLVLLAFVGPSPTNYEACHGNGIRTDNRLANLRWDTRKSNVADAHRHGTAPMGETHHHSKLTDDAVRAIRAEYIPGRPYHSNSRALAARFRVSPRTIRKIAQGTRWQHVK